MPCKAGNEEEDRKGKAGELEEQRRYQRDARRRRAEGLSELEGRKPEVRDVRAGSAKRQNNGKLTKDINMCYILDDLPPTSW